MDPASAHELRRDIVQPSLWTLPEIAGRLVEISSSGASASLTIVFGLVREAQKRREPVGWRARGLGDIDGKCFLSARRGSRRN